jgi:branched-subunit amino acid aminotransferase/4-amino-4-deoxychorismate lyase
VAAGDPIAGFKHTSRLPHVLARSEAEAHGADEALLLNTAGEIVETSAGNVFWIEGETVNTPPISSGALAGITRSLVLGLCASLGTASSVRNFRPQELRTADGVFLTLSSRGIVEAASVDEHAFASSGLIARLHEAWMEVVKQFRAGEVVKLEELAPYPSPA